MEYQIHRTTEAGAKMNCNILLERYLKAVSENSIVKNIEDSCVLITPYLHSHGVYISIFANEENNGSIKIHDNGETLQSLYTRGVKIFENKNREQLLYDICKSYKVEVSGWSIQKIIDLEFTGEAIIDIINALKSVNDLIYLHQTTSSDIFKFEVKMFLKQKNLSFTPDHKIIGKTSSHKIDFYYKKNQSDYFLNVISGSNLQNKVVRSGFSYYDIKESRQNFNWISILNPEDNWSKNSLGILNQFSTTISWKNRDNLIKLLT